MKAFIEYLNDMDDVYKNIEEYNRNKKRKTLIVFEKKALTLKNAIILLNGRQKLLNAFESVIFPKRK